MLLSTASEKTGPIVLSDGAYFQEYNNDLQQRYISLLTQSRNFSICPCSIIMIHITHSVKKNLSRYTELVPFLSSAVLSDLS